MRNITRISGVISAGQADLCRCRYREKDNVVTFGHSQLSKEGMPPTFVGDTSLTECSDVNVDLIFIFGVLR